MKLALTCCKSRNVRRHPLSLWNLDSGTLQQPSRNAQKTLCDLLCSPTTKEYKVRTVSHNDQKGSQKLNVLLCVSKVEPPHPPQCFELPDSAAASSRDVTKQATTSLAEGKEAQNGKPKQSWAQHAAAFHVLKVSGLGTVMLQFTGFHCRNCISSD